MSYNKTIQMCIFDGNPNGTIMCELSNWNGRVYKISRNELSKFDKRSDCENTGVYFLVGKNEDLDDTIYIGEAENLINRLKQHLKDKVYWNDCIVVLSKDNILNKAHVKYLENKFYNLAVTADRAVVVNSNTPTCSSISEFDEAMLVEFIENSKLLVATLGYKVFESVENLKLTTDDNSVFSINAIRGASARGFLVSEGFLVLEGSQMANDTTPSISSGIVALRRKLTANGVVNENYIFTSDYLFTSPSLAAAVVLGRNANGRVEWKNYKGECIKDIEES